MATVILDNEIILGISQLPKTYKQHRYFEPGDPVWTRESLLLNKEEHIGPEIFNGAFTDICNLAHLTKKVNVLQLTKETYSYFSGSNISEPFFSHH